MRLRASVLLALTAPCWGGTFAIVGTQPGSWPEILSSVGHVAGPAATADIFVALPGTPAAADWQTRVHKGAALILEGSSPLGASFGFHAGTETVSVIHIVDVHNEKLPVIWNKAVSMPRYEIPAG